MRLSELRQAVREAAGDAYKVLGLPPDATPDAIKMAFRKKSFELHPDRNPGKDTKQAMTTLSIAYGILSDPEKRLKYDRVGDRTMDTRDGSQFTGRGGNPAKSTGGSTYGYGYSSDDPWRKAAADEKKRWEQDFIDRIRREQERRDRERREAEERRRREAPKAEPSPRPSPRYNPQANAPSADRKRYFEFHDDETNSHKFWWIRPDVTAGTVTVGWGRIGSPGQIKVHNVMGFVNKTLGNMIRNKLRKGYVEKPAPGQSPKPPHPSYEKVPPTAPSAEKKPAPEKPKGPKTTYKVYGRKGPASVHTRFKGTAYGPTQSTKFKSGQQARVNVGSDKRAAVTDPSSNHTQIWDPIPEAFCTLVGGLIVEALTS